MPSRRETEDQIYNLKGMREFLISEAIQQLRNNLVRNDYSPGSSDDSDYRSRVAVYFDRERRMVVAKVMIYPKGREDNFCIIFDADRNVVDWRFTQDRWLDSF